MDNRTALVLGVTGGIGSTVAHLLSARGWRVRALHRTPDRLRGSRFDVVAGDAMCSQDVVAAAAGASLIVHAVNPPGYRNWGQLVLPMLDSTIAAARASGARVLLPGTVYNYGPDCFGQRIDEDAPQHPTTRKGAIRVEMERRLRDSGQRVLIVRAGDFFGPGAANNWFSQGLVQPGKPVASITDPSRGVGHQWGYLPDVAETMVQLVERESILPRFATFHMDGHFDEDGTQMVAAIRRAVGDVPVRRFPWRLAMLASPFVPFLREVREMRYLWREPLRMSNARLVATLGAEPHTPLADAVRTSLRALGCLPDAEGTARGSNGLLGSRRWGWRALPTRG
jgi:nucleoside-diphosphate-sugar epimerase